MRENPWDNMEVDILIQMKGKYFISVIGITGHRALYLISCLLQ